MYFIYVLRLSTGEFYKGISNNLERRIRQHIRGQVFSTYKKLPIELIHVEICNSRTEARNIERYLKSGFGRELVREIGEKYDLSGRGGGIGRHAALKKL